VARPRKTAPRYYKRGNTWFVKFRDADGQLQRKSTKQRDPEMARRAGEQIVKETLACAPPETATPGSSVMEVCARYLANLERKGRAEGTLHFYTVKLGNIVDVFRYRDVNTVTLTDLEEYVDDRMIDVAMSTAAKEVKALRSALRHARKHGIYHGDPSRIIPELDGAYVPRDRFLSSEEFSALHAKLSENRRDYLMAYCGIGARESELYAVTAYDLNDIQQSVRIPGTKTRRADRVVPVSDDVWPVLVRRAHAADTGAALFAPWTNGRRDLAAACKRAGIAPVTFNDLRRTFASRLAEAGVPEITIAQYMGHSTSAMVRRIYAQVSPAAHRHAIDSVAPLLATSATVSETVSETKSPDGRDVREDREQLNDPQRFRVPRDRIELPTRGFSVPCSTD